MRDAIGSGGPKWSGEKRDPYIVAKLWAKWDKTNEWVTELLTIGACGGSIAMYKGVPRRPEFGRVVFDLFDAEGNKLPSRGRLKDLRNAASLLWDRELAKEKEENNNVG